jgi:hypothetical protein
LGSINLRARSRRRRGEVGEAPPFRPYPRANDTRARTRTPTAQSIEVHQLHHAPPTVQSGRLRHAATSTPCRAMTRSLRRGRWHRQGRILLEISQGSLFRSTREHDGRALSDKGPWNSRSQCTISRRKRRHTAEIGCHTLEHPREAAIRRSSNAESYEARRRC